MLKAAGVETLETDLWWMPVQRPYNPNAKRMAEMMQADLAKVGINAKLVSYEWGEYRKRMQAGEHQMGLLGWTGDNGDPDNFLAVLLGCDKEGKPNANNIPKWCDAKFQEAIEQGGADHRPGGAHQALPGRPEDRRRAGAVAEHRPLDRVRAGPQGSLGLQGEPARRPRIPERRRRRVSMIGPAFFVARREGGHAKARPDMHGHSPSDDRSDWRA